MASLRGVLGAAGTGGVAVIDQGIVSCNTILFHPITNRNLIYITTNKTQGSFSS